MRRERRHAAQLRLLDLQAADTALAQLRPSPRPLPELAAIADARSVLTRSTPRARRRADLSRRRDRRTTSPRERRRRGARPRLARRTAIAGRWLPAKELDGLHTRSSLSRVGNRPSKTTCSRSWSHHETAEAALADLTGAASRARRRARRLAATRDAAFAEIDAAAAERTERSRRSRRAARRPAGALRARSRTSGGVGAAMLRQRRCEGCRIELSGSELASVRNAAPDEVVRCDNCRRILCAPPIRALRTDSRDGSTRVIVEADGGSRGNPGPAGYGAAVLRRRHWRRPRRAQRTRSVWRRATSPSTAA